MSKRVSVSKCRVHGKEMWRVRYHSTGKVIRKFLPSRDAAETFASKQRGEAVGVRQLLASIPQHDQEKLVMIYNEARRRRMDILSFLNVTMPAKATAPISGRDVINELIRVKRTAGRAKGYLTNLRTVLNQFIKGRESLDISEFNLPEVEAFLDTKKIEYRPTLRSRLSTLFKFAVRRGYRANNPCDSLEPITVHAKPPVIFTMEQIKTLLAWFEKNPRALAWFVLSTFAGLRPEEAQKTSWHEINFDEDWVKVETQTTKIRERRVVYPTKMAMAWLNYAKSRKSHLPIDAQILRRHRKVFREVVGFDRWPKDITRHTAASMWLADSGNATLVATALGHSERTLRKNYMALVTKVEAEKFWVVLPGKK